MRRRATDDLANPAQRQRQRHTDGSGSVVVEAEGPFRTLPSDLVHHISDWLGDQDTLTLRGINTATRRALADYHWSLRAPIRGSVAAWRDAFPCALVANLRGRADITDADLVHLRGVPSVFLSYCLGITDAGLVHLAGVVELDISFCTQLTGEGFVHLRGSVRTLRMVSALAVRDDAMTHLRGLQALDMAWCSHVTGAGFAHLGGTLRTLKVSLCGAVGDEAFAHLRGLTDLNAVRCDKLTDAALRHLVDPVTGCTSLRRVNVQLCEGITDGVFAHLDGAQEVHVGMGGQFTDQGLASLPATVTDLHVSDCAGITDVGLAHLGSVRVLDISGCEVTGWGFEGLHSLEVLHMANCDGMACDFVDALPARLRDMYADYNHDLFGDIELERLGALPGLRVLSMQGCDCASITTDGVRHLRGIAELDVRGCSNLRPEVQAFLRTMGIPCLRLEE